MTEKLGKYNVAKEESDILPNLLGLTKKHEIDEAETEGILEAQTIVIEELSDETPFDLEYLYHIHELAFKKLCLFAGKLRTVDMSKDGFRFPAAKYLLQSMGSFQKEILSYLPDSYSDTESLIRDIAIVHAELLFIHPFREGNGRIARILANAMAIKQGYALLQFEKIKGRYIQEYIKAVQKAADKDYSPMEKIIRSIF